MPLLNRKRIILAKIETTYGVDPTPSGASNSILIRNLTPTPQDADFVDRNLVRPFMGRSDQLAAGIRVLFEFEVEMAGGGTAGVAPAVGPLLRACGLSETLTAAAVTGAAAAGGASTVTLAAGASAVDDFYMGMPIRITAGTGSGSSGVIVDYVGSTKVATVGFPWAVAPAAASTYSIDANSLYRPISGSFESVTIYFNVDGVLHKALGCRGTVSMAWKVKDIPVFRFKFTGVYQPVTDTVAPTAVFTGFLAPVPVTNWNTSPYSLHGVAAVMAEMSFDLAVSVAHRTLVGGSEAVIVTDRQPQGTTLIEATPVATKDWWAVAKAATTGSIVVSHGITTGQKVIFSANQVQLTKPTYQDMDSIAMLDLGMNFLPGAGNDEINIAFA